VGKVLVKSYMEVGLEMGAYRGLIDEGKAPKVEVGVFEG